MLKVAPVETEASGTTSQPLAPIPPSSVGMDPLVKPDLLELLVSLRRSTVEAEMQTDSSLQTLEPTVPVVLLELVAAEVVVPVAAVSVPVAMSTAPVVVVVEKVALEVEEVEEVALGVVHLVFGPRRIASSASTTTVHSSGVWLLLLALVALVVQVVQVAMVVLEETSILIKRLQSSSLWEAKAVMVVMVVPVVMAVKDSMVV